MAGIYFRKGEYPKAIELLEKALVLSPDYAKARYDLSRILITVGKWNAAAAHVDYLLLKKDDHEDYLNLKGLILLRQKRFAEAIEYFRKSLSVAPGFNTPLIGLGVAYSLSGDYGRAETALNQAYHVPPNSMTALFGLIDNSLRAGDIDRATKYADSLLDHYSAAIIRDELNRLANNNLLPPMLPEQISRVIEKRLAQHSKKFPEISN
jgi:Flp pilus assembly protein TadD